MQAFGHLAVHQVDGAVGARGDPLVVGDHHDGQAGAVLLGDHVEDRLAGLGVQVPGGLVGKQHLRVVHECARDGHALALAAGEFRGAVPEAVREPEAVEERARALADLAAAAQPLEAADTHGGGKERVLEHRQFGQQVIELEHEAHVLVAVAVEPARREGAHVLAAEGHVARVRAVEAAEEVEQGALAASA